METYQLNDEAQTIELGRKIGKLLKPNSVILLDGDLGAGKTTLTKGIAKSMGIERYVKSPTYTIVHEYHDGEMPLYHIDAYRLEDGGSDDIGFEEYFNNDGVTVIEWSQYIEEFLPDEYLRVILDRNSDNTKRLATIEAQGDQYQDIAKQLRDELNGL